MKRTFVAVVFAAVTIAVVSTPVTRAVAQAVPTSLPTTFATTAPTTAPTSYATTAATTMPAYATSAPTTYPTTAATTAPTTRPTVLPGTPPPMHVLTVAYLTNAGEVATNPVVFAPYVTYAYGKTDHLAGMQAVKIQTVIYTNPLQPLVNPSPSPCVGQGDCPAYTLLSGAYKAVAAKDASGNTITGWYGSAKMPALFADPRTMSAPAYVQAVEDRILSYVASANGGKAASDIRFVDNASSLLYNPSASPAPSVTPAAWDAAIASALGATTDGPYIVNSLSSSTIAGAQDELNTLNAPNVIGGEFEECYGGNSGGNKVAAFGATYDWRVAEYAEIQTIALGKQFWCYQRLSGDGAAWIPQRLYTYASFLLTYDPKLAVYGTALSGGTVDGGPPFFPEEQFVPLNPTTTASDVGGYLENGAYVRRFGSCLYQGNNLGPCCVVVNPSSTLSAPSPTGYTRQMILAGDGILDGGTATFDGAVPISIAPLSAEILLQ